MRKVIAATFVSLDGVMQAPGGPGEDDAGGFKFGGWTFPYFDETLGEVMGQVFTREFDLLLGRKTYDIFAAHWPRAENTEDGDIAKVFNRVTKYVATRSKSALEWNNSVVLSDAAKDVAKLKRQDGPVLLIQGSSDLIQTLLAHGLIDEFQVLMFPVLLGKGKRLFGEGVKPGALKLVESKTSATGVVVANYVPDGDVKIGSFALPE